MEEDVDVIKEGTSSLEIISDRISIPDLIGDPELPSASLLDASKLMVDLRSHLKSCYLWNGINGA